MVGFSGSSKNRALLAACVFGAAAAMIADSPTSSTSRTSLLHDVKGHNELNEKLLSVEELRASKGRPSRTSSEGVRAVPMHVELDADGERWKNFGTTFWRYEQWAIAFDFL